MSGLRYGAFVPQGWKLELVGLGAADAWDTAVSVARTAEDLGVLISRFRLV